MRPPRGLVSVPPGVRPSVEVPLTPSATCERGAGTGVEAVGGGGPEGSCGAHGLAPLFILNGQGQGLAEASQL